MTPAMSGPNRLAVLATAVCVVIVLSYVRLSEGDAAPWMYWAFGIAPGAFVWGVRWVRAGYRNR